LHLRKSCLGYHISTCENAASTWCITLSTKPTRSSHEALLRTRNLLALTPHRTTSGADFSTINRKGYVPALVLDDGEVLTEGAAIVQFLADLAPQSGLAPAAGTIARYRLQEWLTFIGTELHKMFSPWLFHPEHGEIAAAAARARIAEHFAVLDAHLAPPTPTRSPSSAGRSRRGSTSRRLPI
jgi:glutathione S-transferase